MQAQECSTSDLKGVYGALAQGSFLGVPGVPSGPTVRVGRVEVDGKGNSSIKAIFSLAGFTVQEEYGGTYSINPDCSATVTLLIPFPGFPAPVSFKFSGVLSDEARQLDMILVEPQGTTVRLTLRKQRKTSCSNSDLSGSYMLNMSGFNLFQVGVPAGEFTRVGMLAFDGKGAFTSDGQVSQGGKVAAEKLTGTYSVDASCRFTMSYSTLLPQTWAGVLTDSSSAGYVMVSSPQGSAIAGSLRQVQ
jgi:hypothetical protein